MVEAANVLEAVAVLGQRKIDAVVPEVDLPGCLMARMFGQPTSMCQPSSR